MHTWKLLFDSDVKREQVRIRKESKTNTLIGCLFCPHLILISIYNIVKGAIQLLTDSKSCEKGKDARIHSYQPRQTVEDCKINWLWCAQWLSAECNKPKLDAFPSLAGAFSVIGELSSRELRVECNDCWSTGVAPLTYMYARLGHKSLARCSILCVLALSQKHVTCAGRVNMSRSCCSSSHPAATVGRITFKSCVTGPKATVEPFYYCNLIWSPL